MKPEAYRPVLTFALLFVIAPGVLLLVEPRQSAAFMISVATLLIGVVFTALVLVVIFSSIRHSKSPSGKKEHP